MSSTMYFYLKESTMSVVCVLIRIYYVWNCIAQKHDVYILKSSKNTWNTTNMYSNECFYCEPIILHHNISYHYLLINYVDTNDVYLFQHTLESIQNCNKMLVKCQLIVEQAPKFFWIVLNTIETLSATKNSLSKVWSLSDHNDPSHQNFSYNEVCRANKATVGVLQQVKLVLD